MWSTDALISRLASQAQAMAGVMPTEREPFALNVGEINTIIRALVLLDAVRGATR
jgi:hypothetical protein